MVLDSSGHRVSTGHVSQPDPDTVSVRLRPGLPDGAYVGDYTVTSTDGHIVSGGVVFLVGAASAGRIGLLARHTSPVAGDLDKLGQFLTYLGVLGACGLAFFRAFVVDDDRERSRLARFTLVAAGAGVVGMAVTVEAQMALVNGGAASPWSTTLARAALSGGLGAQSAVQLVGLAGCLWSVQARRRTTAQSLALYSTLGAAGAFVLFGHAKAASPSWATIPADAVHLFFAALWLGGLIGLVVVLRSRLRAADDEGERRRDGDGGHPGRPPAPPERAASSGSVAVLARAEPILATERQPSPPSRPVADTVLAATVTTVRRVSSLAAVSVLCLLVAGTVLALSLVGSVSALFETTYGQLLLVKLAVFALVLVMAGYNRWFLLPWVMPDSQGHVSTARLGAGWRVLMRTGRAEALGVVVILGLTAVLANSTPPASAAAVARPVEFSQSAPFAGGHLRLRITPNQALVNDLEVQITDANGNPVDHAQSVAAYFTLASPSVGPLEADMTRVGVGRYTLNDTPLPPIVGTWQITLQIRVSDFDETDVTFTDRVR